MKRVLGLLVSLSFIITIATVGVCEGELIAAWSFDDDTAGEVTDVSGNGHDGVASDAEFVDGKFGKALEFDGITSSVEVPHDDVLNIADAVTVEAWVNPSGYNALSAVAQKWGDDTNRRQYLLCFVGDKATFYISGSGTTWPSAVSISSVPTDEWTHIAGTYDGKVIKVYVNGELETETVTDEGLFASDVPVWIGGYGPNPDFGSNRHFPGIIDEVRFWSDALSEEEIQEVMSKSTAMLTAVDSIGKLSVTWGSIRDEH